MRVWGREGVLCVYIEERLVWCMCLDRPFATNAGPGRAKKEESARKYKDAQQINPSFVDFHLPSSFFG